MPEPAHDGAVVFLATAWGTQHGGVNAFNYDISRALARVLSTITQVACVVLDSSASQRDGDVTVISLDPDAMPTFEENRVYEVSRKLLTHQIGPVAWWIGHDVITGPV